MIKQLIYGLLGLLFISCSTTHSLRSFSKQKYTSYTHSSRKYNKRNTSFYPTQTSYLNLNQQNDFELSIQVNTDLLYKPKLKTVLSKNNHSYFSKSFYQDNDKKSITQKQHFSTSAILKKIENQPEEKPISTLLLVLAWLFACSLPPVSVALIGDSRDLKINLILYLVSSVLFFFGFLIAFTNGFYTGIYILAYIALSLGVVGYYAAIIHATIILIKKGLKRKQLSRR